MIITRTPFKITLGGGGTDLPSFYEEHGGYVFTMTIDKYMYIMLNRRSVADRKIVIRYSQVETVDRVDDIQHPLAREALRLKQVEENIELTSVADMPAKTGLGSSGSYLVGLLNALNAYKGVEESPTELAEQACHIEMDILKEPVGKQDQYIAAFGGFRELKIDPDGKVVVEDAGVSEEVAAAFPEKARIYYTGVQRSATTVLKTQDQAARRKRNPDHTRVVDSLVHIKELGMRIKASFDQGDLDGFGRMLDEHWQYKKQMSKSISLSIMDDLYDEVKKHFGVLGGKIIGAGGGGFLMLYCPEKGHVLDEFMSTQGMPRIDYAPTPAGSELISHLTRNLPARRSLEGEGGKPETGNLSKRKPQVS